MNRPPDVIVLGASVDGMVAAALVAKAGRKVLVVEERDRTGVTCDTTEPVPGFRFSRCQHDPGILPADLYRELSLERHGLELRRIDRLAAPRLGGDPVVLAAGAGVSGATAGDSDSWRRFASTVARFGGILEHLYRIPAVGPSPSRISDVWSLAMAGLKTRLLGRRDMMELLRSLPMPVDDLLNDWFDDPVLRGCLATMAIGHCCAGPRSAGTAFGLVHRLVGTGGAVPGRTVVAGGMESLPRALESAAKQYGAEFLTGVAVSSLLVDDGRVAGVVLEDGKELPATCVLSAEAPRRTLLDLLPAGLLDPEHERAVAYVRHRGVAAKVNLALSELPRFEGLDEEELAGTVVLCGDPDQVERGYDHVKYGEMSGEPVIELTVPSVTDPSCAPAGSHVMSLWVQYAPYHIAGGWNDAARDRLAGATREALERYAPGISSAVVHQELLTPEELERDYRLPEGQLWHGQITLDQILFMRPVPGLSRYRGPLPGLFLTGPGTHPGGGLTGQAGRLTAAAVLKGG